MLSTRGLGVAFVVAIVGCSKTEPPPTQESESGADAGGIEFGTDTEDGSQDDEFEKLDVATSKDGPGNGGDCPGSGGSGAAAFSLIWIANSPEGTVSKIDTATGEELARYYTGPTNGDDDPSRTSVNLEGDVAVTNRGSGVAKIAASLSRCSDANGNGTIETSSAADDVLPFGEDECLVWYAELPADGDNRHGPRPTAWDAGSANDPCKTGDDRLWVGWWNYEANEGIFRRLDGADGATLDEVAVPDWDPDQGTHYGPYGGAVDSEGNLWAVGRSPGPLVRIDAVTLDTTRFEVPDPAEPYGIAMGADGHPWLAGTEGYVLHFDPDSEAFDLIDVGVSGRLRGLQIDREGSAWVAANNECGVVRIDTSTQSVVGELIPLPDCDDPVGVSIDNEGFVWVPDRGTDRAYKLDPATSQATMTEGLVAPYTYSDMTGAGLGLVVNPPQG